MKHWQKTIFDDSWKYLVGLAGGSSVTGYISNLLSEIPVWIWLLVMLAVTSFFSIGLYWYWHRASILWHKRHFYSNWQKLKKILPPFNSNASAKKQKDYSRIQQKLGMVTSSIELEIQNFLKAKYPDKGKFNLGYNSFKQCFSSPTLDEWAKHCSRKEKHEIDCFDELAREIQSLKI